MLGIILSTHLRTCDIPKSPEEFKLNPTKPEKIGKTTTEHMHTLLQKRNYWRHAPGSGAWHIPGAQEICVITLSLIHISEPTRLS